MVSGSGNETPRRSTWAVVVQRIDGGKRWENCRHADRASAQKHAEDLRHMGGVYVTAEVVERAS